MKIIRNNFKTLFLLLFVGFAFTSCSKDDDTNPDTKNDDLKTGNATAVIGVDNQTIQFSSDNENSFATKVNTKIGENEIDQLVIVMMDEDSDVMIVAQAAPAPDNAITYDLSKPLTEDSFFTAGVGVEGKNSSDDKTYGVGTYQQGNDLVIQSKGTFKITSLSSTTIKGTFEMTLYNNYDPNDAQDAKKLTITKGTFDLPIVELNEKDLGDLGLD